MRSNWQKRADWNTFWLKKHPANAGCFFYWIGSPYIILDTTLSYSSPSIGATRSPDTVSSTDKLTVLVGVSAFEKYKISLTNLKPSDVFNK